MTKGERNMLINLALTVRKLARLEENQYSNSFDVEIKSIDRSFKEMEDEDNSLLEDF